MGVLRWGTPNVTGGVMPCSKTLELRGLVCRWVGVTETSGVWETPEVWLNARAPDSDETHK